MILVGAAGAQRDWHLTLTRRAPRSPIPTARVRPNRAAPPARKDVTPSNRTARHRAAGKHLSRNALSHLALSQVDRLQSSAFDVSDHAICTPCVSVFNPTAPDARVCAKAAVCALVSVIGRPQQRSGDRASNGNDT